MVLINKNLEWLNKIFMFSSLRLVLSAYEGQLVIFLGGKNRRLEGLLLFHKIRI